MTAADEPTSGRGTQHGGASAPAFSGAAASRLRRALARASRGRVVPEALLFLLLWFAYGAAINSDNLLQFNLQQIGVEAIAERGHFYLEGSRAPQLQPLGDVFLHDGHKYAAKQPGQFMAGAVVYALLRATGLTYERDYLLAAALVTFLTTSLVLAASGVAVYRLARGLSARGRGWPLAAALVYALATTVFPYSGIAHHDALATGYLAIAFCLVFTLEGGRPSARHARYATAGAGLLVGLALTTSMLGAPVAAGCGLYFLALRRWRLVPLFLCATLAGLLPLFVYDAASFGDPLLLPNVAGREMFADTFFDFDPRNFGDKLAAYATALALYAPAFPAGLFGLSYLPRARRRSALCVLLCASVCALVLYVCNIRTGGDCQFGPRYLLPAMPLACLGLAGYSHLAAPSERRFASVLVGLAGLYGFVINLGGAAEGAMCCPDGRGAWRKQLASLARGEWRAYPLLKWLAAPLVISALLCALVLYARGRTAGRGPHAS